LSKSIPNLANSTGKSADLNTRAEGVKGESGHRVSRREALEIQANTRQHALRTRVGDSGARAGPNVKAGSRATSPRGDARHVHVYRRDGEGTWAGMLDGTGDTERGGEARSIRDRGQRRIGETGDGTWTRGAGCGGTAVTSP